MSRAPLDVYVAGQIVGTLAEEGGQYVFAYLPACLPSLLKISSNAAFSRKSR